MWRSQTTQTQLTGIVEAQLKAITDGILLLQCNKTHKSQHVYISVTLIWSSALLVEPIKCFPSAFIDSRSRSVGPYTIHLQLGSCRRSFFSYLMEVSSCLVPFITIPELFFSCHFCQAREPATYQPEREHLCRNEQV